MHVDSFGGETWWDGGGLFFRVVEEDREVFDGGHRDVTTVVASEEGLGCGQLGLMCQIAYLNQAYLSLEVEKKNGGRHGEEALWPSCSVM